MDIMSNMDVNDGQLPLLECCTFSGNEEDKFAFNTFLMQFINVRGSRKIFS